jgi:hypothetical protein
MYEVEIIQNAECLVFTEFRILILDIIHETGDRNLRTSLIMKRREFLSLEKTDNKRLFG